MNGSVIPVISLRKTQYTPFPVANFGRLSWVTLAWWNRDDDGHVDSSGLFPVAYFGDWSYIGPWWWTDDWARWGLFPLFARGYAGVDYVGPAWWDEDGSRFGLLPLLHYANDGDRLLVVPFYAHELGEGSASRYYLMGLGHADRTPEYQRRWILPFWYAHDAGEAFATRYYLMGLGHTDRTDEHRRSWLLPLWYDYDRGQYADRLLLPLYFRRERPGASHVFTLLGDRRVAPEGRSLNVYPVWWSSVTEEASWRLLLPLFYYGDEQGDRQLITPLGGRGWSASGDIRYLNVLGPVYHHNRAADGSRSFTAFVWPLFERRRKGDETTTRALPFFTRESSPSESELWLALGLGHHARTPDDWSARFWPLAAVSRSVFEAGEPPSPLYRYSFYGDHAHGGRSDRYLFPLYRRQAGGESAESSFLLGLGRHARRSDGVAWHALPLMSWSDGRYEPSIDHWFTLFGGARWDDGSSLHVGSPLLYVHRAGDDGRKSWSDSRLLTIFDRRTEERDPDFIPATVAPNAGDVVTMRRLRCLFVLFFDEKE